MCIPNLRSILIPTWYNSLSECVLWLYHLKFILQDVFQTISDLDFKTAVLCLNKEITDLVPDKKNFSVISQKPFKDIFVMLIRLVGMFEDVFILLSRTTVISSSMSVCFAP